MLIPVRFDFLSVYFNEKTGGRRVSRTPWVDNDNFSTIGTEEEGIL